MLKHPSISIVVNTWNRGQVLGNTLNSFRWLKYPGEFEIVVVNGPSTDNTEEVLALWGKAIRIGRCPIPNLSVSRNIGICMAQGDIVAFIDDDAIPEPEWLIQLADAYKDPQVGAAGGFVFDHTGYDFQYKHCLIDRFGNADSSIQAPFRSLCFPYSYKIPHLLGANSSYRRDVLLEVRGYDEEYEYFLDETDLQLRIIDAGYIIEQLDRAYVYHKFAPSNIRNCNRITKNNYPVIKNKIYFTLKHAKPYHSDMEIRIEQNRFVESRRQEVLWAIGAQLMSSDDADRFEVDAKKAIEVGNQRGEEGILPGSMINEEKLVEWNGPFLPFFPILLENPRVIVLVTQDFPPKHGGGIATFNKDLAEALAELGHIIHVITRSSDTNRVDFENGVWVHRLIPREIPLSHEARVLEVPQHIWNWSASALDEVRRISSHRAIDVVEAPIWDCEGVAFMCDRQWPLVVSLQTTLHFWLKSHPDHAANAQWMREFGSPMLTIEKQLMIRADGVRSISSAIRREIEEAYEFSFSDSRIVTSPLGMRVSNRSQSSRSVKSDALTVLFVGRLEERKGIDVLLGAIPGVLAEISDVTFRILGDDTITGPDEKISYKEAFLSSDVGQSCSQNVVFMGRVDDVTLCAAYADCDIFVAPSRFESFGLVFLEAMREGKPVIGCLAGGISEVVSHEESGILVPPGDVSALSQAIIRLLRSASARKKMGDAGLEIFKRKFTSEMMAVNSYSIYDLARENYGRPLKKVSYINSLCVYNDAISNAVRDGVLALAGRSDSDVRIYAYKCEHKDLPFEMVDDERGVLTSEFHEGSDLVVFHFGIYYPLFDLLKLPAGKSKRLVVFHNVTPKAFVSAESHELIDRSMEQMGNIRFADHVICDSEVNLAVLRNAGIQTPATVLPLAVHVSHPPPPAKPSFNDGTLRILFIGRFVSSKGPLDLLQAIHNALALNAGLNLQVNMIGNLEFSDPKIVAEIKASIQLSEKNYPKRLQVVLHGSATDEVKATMLRNSDLFVLPTYHEGFCVPIIEAFANGCRVIAYENSNVPSISGGFATLVPTGDIGLLSQAISMVWKQVLSVQWKATDYKAYLENLLDYVERFSPEQVASRFNSVVDKVLAGNMDFPNVHDDSSRSLSRNESGVVAKHVNKSITGISGSENNRLMPSQQLSSEAQTILTKLKSEIQKAQSNANCH